MEVKYLENLLTNSQKTYELFKKGNVLNSSTLKEMFTPKYIYKGDTPNTVLVKSLKTNKPVKVFWKDKGKQHGEQRLYDYWFYDKNNQYIGEKSFCIESFPVPPGAEKEMIAGYMSSDANDMYIGLGVREEELQVKKALENDINIIPRSALGPATLYHIKMGYLPKTDDLLEVQSENEVNFHMNGIRRKSPDIREKNFTPIITKEGDKYYIDVNLTQAVANVKEIKDRLAEGETKKEIGNLDMEGIPMSLSGKEFEYWKNLIINSN